MGSVQCTEPEIACSQPSLRSTIFAPIHSGTSVSGLWDPTYFCTNSWGLLLCFCLWSGQTNKQDGQFFLPVFTSWAPGKLLLPPGGCWSFVCCCHWESGCHRSLDGLLLADCLWVIWSLKHHSAASLCSGDSRHPFTIGQTPVLSWNLLWPMILCQFKLMCILKQ